MSLVAKPVVVEPWDGHNQHIGHFDRLARERSKERVSGGRIFSILTTVAEAPPAPSPCEARARRGLGRGAPSIEYRIGAANWNPLSLTLSPLLRRGGEGIDQRHGSGCAHAMRPAAWNLLA